MRRSLIVLSAVAAMLFGSAAFAQPAARLPELTAEQWREDLRVMAAEMQRRHPNLYHRVSKEKFEAAIADLEERIPTLQRNEIIVGMMRISAMATGTPALSRGRIRPSSSAHFP